MRIPNRIGKPLKTQTMKKIYTLAALAMVAIVACNQEIDINNDSQTIDEQLDEVTVTALAPIETKTSVDGLNVKWATGDHVAIFDEDGGLHDFTLSDGAGTTTGTFSGNLGGKSSLGYAVYPYSINADFDGDVTVDYPDTYAYNAVTVPMWGEEGTGVNVGKYTFDHVGGAFKIRYYNVPASADKFVFTATTNITGTVVYDFTDADVMDNEGKVVTVTDLPASTSLTFIIPVPAGSYSFTVRLKDSSDDDIAGSVKTVSSAKTVAVGHLLPLREIVIPPVPNNTVLWSDDFGTFGDGGTNFDTISGADISDYASDGYKGRSGIGDNGYVTLAATGSVKVSTTSATGLTSGHLWFKKSADGAITTSAIKLYGNTGFTLTYDQATGSSESIAEYSDDGGSSWKSLGTQAGPGSAEFSKGELAVSSIMIRIKHQSSNTANTRIDNLVVKSGVPAPGITVSTGAASATSTVAGTTATLNGSLTLINGAVNANVTEAGFYYKLTGAGVYTKVTCASAPTSTTLFSYDLTGLTTDSEYTYYAYAVYASGSEVTGKATEKTFTPTKSSGEPKTATYNITNIDAETVMGSGSYGSYKNTDVAITIGGLASIANNICKNPNNQPPGATANSFIQIKASTGYIKNSTGKNISAITITCYTDPEINLGSTSGSLSAASFSKGSSSTVGGITMYTYTITVPSGTKFFSLAPSSTFRFSEMVVTYTD